MLSKKTIGFLLKIGIVIFSLFFLLNELTDRTTVNQLNSNDLISQIQEHWVFMIAVFAMMFLNWSIEALKWQFLINKIEDISFLKSLRMNRQDLKDESKETSVSSSIFFS